MPPKKSKSPKSGKSPKSDKKSKSPKNKKGSPPEEENYVWVRPQPPPPPPDPPKSHCLWKIRRQVWYPYANRLHFEYKEWFWSPYCPVITSWGDVWISEPQQRRIQRYTLDPVSAKIKRIPQPIITKGEPRMIIEIPRTGRIAALLTGPKALSTALVLYDPIELKEEKRIEFKYTALDPAEIPTSTLPDSKEPEPRKYTLLDESTPIGMCADLNYLVVVFQPLQRLKIYNPVTLAPYDVMLENAFPDENTCIHLASSGGCAMYDDYLYVAATRPPRIQVLKLHDNQVLGRVDLIHVVIYSDLGLDRLSFGEPFGVQVDSLGMLVVSDSKAGFFHVYNVRHRPAGPWIPSLEHGSTCYMGSWKIDAYQPIRPGHFSLSKNGCACVVDRWNNKIHLIMDQTELRWYDDTYCVLEDLKFHREVVDPLMPRDGLPRPPSPTGDNPVFQRRISNLTEPYPDEVILPESWVARFRRKGQPPAEPESKSPKGKSKGKGKGKGSPKSKGKGSPNSKRKK
ncbi:hypothetical protein AAHC03_04584 [Spirometra sp. Aus1]